MESEIKICDYSPLSQFLQAHFPIEIFPLEKSDSADYILGDTFTPIIEHFDGIRILYTGENHPVDLNRFDYCLTHELREDERCHRLPYWQVYCLNTPSNRKKLLEPRHITKEELLAEERDFCAFVCRNPKGKKRNSLVRHLMKYRKVN